MAVLWLARREAPRLPTAASPKAPTFGAPLVNGATITCEVRLAMNIDKQTELVIIILSEHLPAVVAQNSQALDLDFDHIVLFEPKWRVTKGANAVRGSGDNYIPG